MKNGDLILQTRRMLEFDKAKEIIAGFAGCAQSRNLIASISPLSDIEDVYEAQSKIRQIAELISNGVELASEGLEDSSEILIAAEKGIMLSAPDFSLLRKNLSVAFSMKKALEPWRHLPFVSDSYQSITYLPELAGAIDSTFGDGGEIRDSASFELAEIRAELAASEISAHAKINSILRDPQKQKMFQESLWTIREGRFVIPVKQEYRGVFEGLVLDVSASGSTLFMEPLQIVQLNNEIKRARAQEKAEILRILKKLSAMAAEYKRELLVNQEAIAKFDMNCALARYMVASSCILPKIGGDGRIVLKKARHPLLGDKAIPIDIEAGCDFSALVITGPNTGGKTVSLKTAGLFALLALSGLPIPADEGSEISMFSGVYADIGDDQSIAQNLSTFSSHMNRIISILNEAGEQTLVLLDELGAGTDPREGAALAAAILEDLIDRGSVSIVTTHYGELKYFAANHPKARNAAMEFDNATLMPSYKITVGVPGRSCALSIASGLGLDEQIVIRAQNLISHEYVEMDRLLSEIEQKERLLNDERTALIAIKSEAEELKHKYEEDISLIKAEQLELLAESAAESDSLVIAAKNEIQKIIGDFKKELKESSAKDGENKKSEIDIRTRAESRLNNIIERLKTFRKSKKITAGPDEWQFKNGEEVYIASTGRLGVIEEIKGNEVLVSMNRLKMRIPYWNLRKTSGKKNAVEEKPDIPLPKEASSSINLIGKYADEAIYELEKYMSEAVYSGLQSFTVIHGRGAGILRKAVANFLSRSPFVADFRSGEPNKGGDGTTVVTLK